MRRLVGLIGLVALLTGLFGLERARVGIEITQTDVSGTPITRYHTAPGPAVVIAHGFAGSMQIMEAYALTLARAGYQVVSFDFEGHGRNPQPMRGDVNLLEGTTRFLMDETLEVIAFAKTLPGADGRVAVLGHSMATDVLARVAIEAQIDTVVGVSMYSKAVSAEAPARLLMVSGQWEGMLRDFGVRAVNQVAPGGEGDTVRAGNIERRAAVAPGVEHVGVLWSTTALQEARDWIDQGFGRSSTTPVAATGGWIILMLVGLVALTWPLTKLLPPGVAPRPVPPTVFWTAVVIPAIATPLILALFDIRFLPVLVADYLAVHLGLYGLLCLAILRAGGVRLQLTGGLALAALLFWGLLALGGLLDRYIAAYWPIPARLPIIAAIALGAILALVSETVLTQAGSASFLRKAATRLSLLGSLAIAVALDFDGLFFLILILPLILLFYASFGVVGGWIGRRTGATLGVGAGLGICLGWSLGVSFPMFAG